MDMLELVTKSRSYRRFDETEEIGEDRLLRLCGLGRLCPSAANAQSLKFMPVCGKEGCARVFETLRWAAALPDWDGPEKGERPTGYLILLNDRTIGAQNDISVGICAQTMMLGAAEMGFGGCMLLNVDRKRLSEALSIDENRFQIALVLALGRPAEEVELVPLPKDGSTKYYRDSAGRHYVPKRSLSELVMKPKLP